MSLESSYRKQDVQRPSLHATSSSSCHSRRATVGSPSATFAYSNTFELDRPRSRNGKLHDHRYPYPRRSTISHSQGHNVNDSMKLTPNADTSKMWSDSASPSPVMSNTIALPGSSPTLSSASSHSPKFSEANFEYEHMAFSNTLPPSMASFNLCPSPAFNGPRALLSAPETLVPHPNPWSDLSHTSGADARDINTPALSPAASSSTFMLEGTFVPSTDSSPRSFTDNSHGSVPSHDESEEIKRLRQRVQELESIAYGPRLHVDELEADNKAHIQNEQQAYGLGLQTNSTNGSTGHSMNAAAAVADQMYQLSSFSFLNQNLGPPPADWPNRTAARLKRLCALNRAGNALCSWHDPRRERRAYPPRMAPPQTLNCGCTYAEALFEESLARNGVGAFYPGGHVRMDPALRNPLLKLLEQRYGYRDGDFERTPDGGWREGEDAHSWEQKVTNAGRSSRRER